MKYFICSYYWVQEYPSKLFFSINSNLQIGGNKRRVLPNKCISPFLFMLIYIYLLILIYISSINSFTGLLICTWNRSWWKMEQRLWWHRSLLLNTIRKGNKKYVSIVWYMFTLARKISKMILKRRWFFSKKVLKN